MEEHNEDALMEIDTKNNYYNIKKICEDADTCFKLKFKHRNEDFYKCDEFCASKSLKTIHRNINEPSLINYVDIQANEIDHVLQLIKFKQKHQHKIERLKSKYRTNLKKRNVTKQIQCYKDMQKLLDVDPDKYLFSNYNWYYTGGNLDIKTVSNELKMFYVTGNKYLNLANIHRDSNSWILTNKKQLIDKGTDIYQIESFNNSTNTYIYTRHKNEISFYECKHYNTHEAKCKLIKLFVEDKPFVGLTHFELDNKFATVDVNQTIKLYNNLTSQEIFQNQIVSDNSKTEDCFAHIEYSDKFILSYINRTNFKLLDERCKSPINILQCDKILSLNDTFSNIYFNDNNYNYYISTAYNLIQIDVRMKHVVNKSSHSFTSAPYQCDSLNHKGNNIICISSCKPDEKLMFEHNQRESFIPQYLPTLNQFLDSTILSHSNYDKSLYIRERLNMSTTGLKLVDVDNNTFTLFSLNSLGDIFSFDILFENNLDTITDEKISEWHHRINPQNWTNRKLHFVEKVILKELELNVKDDPVNIVDSYETARLQRCVENLKQKEKDYIEKISEIWFEEDRLNLENIEELPANTNIANWLNNLSEIPPDEK